MTRITSSTSVSLQDNEALFTLAKVTDTSSDYRYVASLNSLVITLIENQTGSTQTVTVGDFQYLNLLTPGSPLYYMKFSSSRVGPYYLNLYNSSGNRMSTVFDLVDGDSNSTICIIPFGRYNFGPLD